MNFLKINSKEILAFWLKIVILKSNWPISVYYYIRCFDSSFRRIVWTFYQGGDWWSMYGKKWIYTLFCFSVRKKVGILWVIVQLFTQTLILKSFPNVFIENENLKKMLWFSVQILMTFKLFQQKIKHYFWMHLILSLIETFCKGNCKFKDLMLM